MLSNMADVTLVSFRFVFDDLLGYEFILDFTFEGQLQSAVHDAFYSTWDGT
jgi:hypothetical protein